MRRRSRLGALAISCWILGSCSPLERAFKPAPSEAPPIFTGKYFVVDPPPGISREMRGKVRTGVRISELGKSFLLQGSVVAQVYAPQFHGLRSRIVFFQDQGDTLAMMESIEGYTATPDLRQNLVLAVFSILQRDSEWIFFDFAAGMNKLYVARDWMAQDLGGPADSATAWNQLPLTDTFISQAVVGAAHQLVLEQVGQTVQVRDGVHQAEQVNLHYYLSLYEPRKGFEPKLSPGFDQAGFFELAPQIHANTRERDIYVTKFAIDGDRVIEFSLSDNTPMEFRGAIADGLLYWNKAFGREVVRIVAPTKGEQAPSVLHNLVQWIPWDSAGSAYADAQMDPRTGEILHAQIFMTSAFAFTGISRAQHLVDLLQNPQTRKREWVSLSGFHQVPLCVHQIEDTFLHAMSRLLATPGIQDAKILQVAQDYVRSVIAHEMGHVLGLRHNFAGSLAANFEPQQKKSLYREYLTTGRAPVGLQTSSSVMDYQLFEEATLTGNLLVSRTQAFPYDQKAISILYEGKSFTTAEMPPFCTDSHIGKFADCKTFDSGSNPVESVYWSEKLALERLPHELLWMYLRAKKLSVNAVDFSLRHVTPDPIGLLSRLYGPRKNLLDLFREGTRWLSVQRTVPYLNAINSEEVVLRNQTAFAGFWQDHSVSQVFHLLSAEEVAQTKEHMNTLLQSYQNQSSPEVVLTEEDVILIKEELEKLFAKLPAAAVQVQLEQQASVQGLLQHPVSDALASAMRETARTVILSGKLERGDIPFRFAYALDMRLKAAGLLKSKSVDLTWGASDLAQLRGEVKRFLTDLLGVDPMKFAVETASREKQRWVLENRALLGALGIEKGSETL